MFQGLELSHINDKIAVEFLLTVNRGRCINDRLLINKCPKYLSCDYIKYYKYIFLFKAV
jgi:hypothetical protein